MIPTIIRHRSCLLFTDGHGKLHNLNGPARIWTENPNDSRSGLKEWWVNGKKFKEHWPSGVQIYFKDDKYHRIDGAAFIRSDGYMEWWIDGKFIRNNK